MGLRVLEQSGRGKANPLGRAGVPGPSAWRASPQSCVCMHEKLRMFSADFARGAARVSLDVFILT